MPDLPTLPTLCNYGKTKLSRCIVEKDLEHCLNSRSSALTSNFTLMYFNLQMKELYSQRTSLEVILPFEDKWWSGNKRLQCNQRNYSSALSSFDEKTVKSTNDQEHSKHGRSQDWKSSFLMQRTYLESVLTQPIGVITFKNFIDVQFQRKSKYISSFSPEQQISFQNSTYKMNNVLETSKSFFIWYGTNRRRRLLPFESWFFSVNLTLYGAKLLNNFTSKFDCIRRWPGTRVMTEARSYKNIITEIFDFVCFIIFAICIPLLHQIERLPCFQKVERIARMINRLNLFWHRKENISRKCSVINEMRYQ